MDPNFRRTEYLVDTYEPYPSRFPLHLSGFVLIYGGRAAYSETRPKQSKVVISMNIHCK